MACDHIRGKGPGGQAVEIFICSRGSRAKSCAVAGCRRRATKLCDYPLSGAKKGKTCDRAICDDHAHQQGAVDRIDGGMHVADTVDYCPAHHELTRSTAEGP